MGLSYKDKVNKALSEGWMVIHDHIDNYNLNELLYKYRYHLIVSNYWYFANDSDIPLKKVHCVYGSVLKDFLDNYNIMYYSNNIDAINDKILYCMIEGDTDYNIEFVEVHLNKYYLSKISLNPKMYYLGLDGRVKLNTTQLQELDKKYSESGPRVPDSEYERIMEYIMISYDPEYINNLCTYSDYEMYMLMKIDKGYRKAILNRHSIFDEAYHQIRDAKALLCASVSEEYRDLFEEIAKAKYKNDHRKVFYSKVKLIRLIALSDKFENLPNYLMALFEDRDKDIYNIKDAYYKVLYNNGWGRYNEKI